MPFNPFQKVRVNRPGRSVFDLSYEKKFPADMGILYPVLHEEAVPGDHWKIGNQLVIRFMPLLAPLLHEVNVTVHYFFVPFRLLWDEWEEFITRGVSGDETPVLPIWTPSLAAKRNEGTLWDYFGYPTGVSSLYHNPLDWG